MPVYDRGYAHWSGESTSRPYRWWVISRQGIRVLVQKKAFVVLVLLSAIPFLVRSVMIYLSTVLGAVRFLNVDAGFFESFLNQQMFFVFAIAIYAGAGLVANDLKANALQIYFSKPITKSDYILGKLGVLTFFLALPTLIPGLALFGLAVAFHSNLGFLKEYFWVVGAILVYSLAIILVYSTIVLALSSLTKSSRFAGICFAAVFFFSQVVAVVLQQILRSDRFAWLSPANNLSHLGDLLFGGTPGFEFSPWISILALLLWMTTSVTIVHRRVAAVEIVS